MVETGGVCGETWVDQEKIRKNKGNHAFCETNNHGIIGQNRLRQYCNNWEKLRVCVCVNHLNRCKTSTRLVAGGHGSIHQSVDQLHVPALFQFHFFVNGNRLSPEPACRNLHFSVVTRGILHLELRSKRELQNSFLKWISFIKNYVF